MATRIETIWSDLDPGFIEDAQGQLKLVENMGAVLSSIDNILRTNRKERVMLPQFGANFHNYVFESINSPILKFLAREVKQMIEVWEPRVTISEVELVPYPDQQELHIAIQFVIRGYSDIFKYETSIRG